MAARELRWIGSRFGGHQYRKVFETTNANEQSSVNQFVVQMLCGAIELIPAF